MSTERGRVCPVERAGSLDNKLRKLLQNPAKILSPFVKEGMKVLDMGCGPGFFSIEMAKMVGAGGKVFSADVQDGMLQKVKNKIEGSQFKKVITPVKCGMDGIPINEKMDFILAFYMVHEVPDKEKFFMKLNNILDEKGQFLIVEPKFHVKKTVFDETLAIARRTGFNTEEGPKLAFSFSAVLKKS